MTEAEYSAEMIKKLIAGEATTRGETLGVLVKAFVDQYGPEAIDIAKKALFELGEKQGKAKAHLIDEKGVIGFRRVSSSAPNAINPFNPEEVELHEEKGVIRLHSCLLHESWKGLGYSEAFAKELCDIAMERDYGQLKAISEELELEIPKLLAYGDEYCELVVQKKGSSKLRSK